MLKNLRRNCRSVFVMLSFFRLGWFRPILYRLIGLVLSFNERKLLACAFMCFEREGDLITYFFSTLFNIPIFGLNWISAYLFWLSGIILFQQVKFFEWLFVLRARWTHQLFIGA